MTIKDIFNTSENGTLTYEQFEAMAKAAKSKFADLSDGEYVAKSKYEADLKAKDTNLANVTGEIDTLKATIATRDEDLTKLQKQLEEAGQDATKLADLQNQFKTMQTKYDEDVANYKAQMSQQAYEFAVKEFAGTKQFTSQAAKRDFERSMIARGLQMEDGKILGREDFVNKYAEENSDAFYHEPEPEVEEPVGRYIEDIPQFVAPTPGPSVDTSMDQEFDFNFQGVRAH